MRQERGFSATSMNYREHALDRGQSAWGRTLGRTMTARGRWITPSLRYHGWNNTSLSSSPDPSSRIWSSCGRMATVVIKSDRVLNNADVPWSCYLTLTGRSFYQAAEIFFGTEVYYWWQPYAASRVTKLAVLQPLFLTKMSNDHVKFKSSSNSKYYKGNNGISTSLHQCKELQ